jgi:hypothetical protein
MNWCCQILQWQFALRGQDSSFVFAARTEPDSEVGFFMGQVAIRVVDEAAWPESAKSLREFAVQSGVTNLKLVGWGAISLSLVRCSPAGPLRQ